MFSRLFLFFFPPFLPFFLSFLRATGEITYRETVKSVRYGSFIGRVGALALESARGEDFDERAFPVGSRGLPFAIRTHAQKLGELVPSRRAFPQVATKGNGSAANRLSTVARILIFALLETLIPYKIVYNFISIYFKKFFQRLHISHLKNPVDRSNFK